MRIEYEGVQWNIGDESIFHRDGHYDKNLLLKRAQAFENIFFRMYARKINNYKENLYYAKNDCQKQEIQNLITETLLDLEKRLKPLLEKIILLEDAKSFYVLRNSFYNFCIIIRYPIPFHVVFYENCIGEP